MPGKRMNQLSGRSLEYFQMLRECHLDLMQITPQLFKAQTALFGRSRGTALEAVDRELGEYHAMAMTGTGTLVERIEELALHNLVLYYALETWKKDRNDKNPTKTGRDAWKHSTRNTSGMFTRFEAIVSRYATLTMRYTASDLPADEAAAYAYMRGSNVDTFHNVFKGARMIPKKSFVRECTATAAAATIGLIGDRTGLTERATTAVSSLADTAQTYVADTATHLHAQMATTTTYRDAESFVRMIVDYVQRGAQYVVDAQLVRDIVSQMGIAYDFFQSLLTKIAATVGKAVYDLLGGAVIGNMVAAVQAFYKAISAWIKERAGSRNRFIMPEGAPAEAYDVIVNFWTEEKREALKDAAVSLAKGIIAGVATAVGGPAGTIISGVASAAEKAYAAAKKVWDIVSKIVNTINEIVETNYALRSLRKGELNNTKALFEKSSLLATYYLMVMPTSGIIMLDQPSMTLRGYSMVIDRLVKLIDPVREKAAEFIAESKFMFIGENRKPLPVKAKLGDAKLSEQIKELIGDKVGDLLPDPSEIAEDFADEQIDNFLAPAREAMGITADA
jgi:hypothetical protein